MPNWCHNYLRISGEPKEVALFKERAAGPTQNYNHYDSVGSWPAFENVRLKAIWQVLPEPGKWEVLSFHKLYPIPDHVLRLPYDCNQARKVGGVLGIEVEGGGYHWEAKLWGVKWGAVNPYLEDDGEDYLFYNFDTPWGPPISFLEKVSADWPNLKFELEWETEGDSVRGFFDCQNGAGEYNEEKIFESEELDE